MKCELCERPGTIRSGDGDAPPLWFCDEHRDELIGWLTGLFVSAEPDEDEDTDPPGGFWEQVRFDNPVK